MWAFLADDVQRNRDHVGREKAASRFLFHPLAQVRVPVAKGHVARVLCLGGGDQALGAGQDARFRDPMDVVGGQAAAFQKVGAEDRAVIGAAEERLQRHAQGVDLGRIVAAQGRVAAADNVHLAADLARSGGQVDRDLAVKGHRLVLG